MSSQYLFEESLLVGEVSGAHQSLRTAKLNPWDRRVSSHYLLKEFLFIREVNGANPESANGEAESLRTGKCPPANLF